MEKEINILLDAGHYGKRNRSPCVFAYYESEAMWKLHLALKQALEEGYQGVRVDVTREDQSKDLSVNARGRMAKGYDLALSEHSNAVGDNKCTSTDRVDVFYAWDNFNDAQVLADKLMRVTAACMGVTEGKAKTRKSTNGDWDYYGFMRSARSVGCPLYYIVENSFHTNESAALWLLEDDNIEMLADAQADAIAEHFSLKPKYSVGDVNGDGKVNAQDYVLIKRILMGTYKPTDEELRRCDVNGDGKVSASDYIMLKRKIMGTL